MQSSKQGYPEGKHHNDTRYLDVQLSRELSSSWMGCTFRSEGTFKRHKGPVDAMIAWARDMAPSVLFEMTGA